ncbi:MAG: hypothetical protein LBQ66_16005 [Planctomycetaceae bacterium]|jgi:predicted  nucleic acid-binding Zn-ribbon protein|nr:hypothetical protein [Planctomycetaceae bacterium]
MIQEQISTSSPRCLDGNVGFGVVAQTSGMASNLSREVNMLSGYSHIFDAGDVRNPVSFFHVMRRSGGIDRHVVSRVADCGNDYSGRTNRIAHHLIIDEIDCRQLSCGPAAVLLQAGLFRSQWNEPAQELPRGRVIQNPAVTIKKCVLWERYCGDAGWAGVVAERVERGDPISLIFEAETRANMLMLLGEAFAILTPEIRWRTTFSTLFMKSQEPPSQNKIQIKCILANSAEAAFAKLTPNTLVLDLRQYQIEVPKGKYVEQARTGTHLIPIPTPTQQQNEKIIPQKFKQTEQTNQDKEQDDTPPIPIVVPKFIKGVKSKENVVARRIFMSLILMLLIATNVVGFISYKQQDNKINGLLNELDKTAAENERINNEIKKLENDLENIKITTSKSQQETKKIFEQLEKLSDLVAIKNADTDKNVEKNSKKEKEQKEAAERKKKEINELLTKLPNDWTGLEKPAKYTLENSKPLLDRKYKDNVKISYEPFADLNFEIKDTKKLHHENINQHQITVYQKTGETKDNIVTIELNDEGLTFKWNEKYTVATNRDEEEKKQFNRILLAKLKVEIGENSKLINLFEKDKRNGGVDAEKFTLLKNGDDKVLSNATLYFHIKKLYVDGQVNDNEIEYDNDKIDLITKKNTPSVYSTKVIYKREPVTIDFSVQNNNPFCLKFTQQKGESKIDGKKIRLEEFSVYLLRQGTKVDEVKKPENRILLQEFP